MKKYILMIALVASSNLSFATPLSEEDSRTFYTHLNKSCLAREANSLADNQIKQSCDCWATKIINLVSHEDLLEVGSSGSNKNFTAAIISAGNSCKI